MTLRVGVNLLWLVPGVVGGSEEYTTRLLAGVANERPDDIELVLFVLRPFLAAYPELVAAFPTDAVPLSGGVKGARVAAEATWLAWHSARRQVDLVHHAGGTMPVVRSRPGIVTVYDLQPLLLPAHFRPLKRRYLEWRLPPSIRKARLVLTQSEDSKRSVVTHLGADPDRIAVVPPGIGIEPEPETGPTVDPASFYGIDGPFFLYPAITYPHKNHLLLLRAFAQVVARRPDALMVLTGGHADEEPALRAMIDSLGIAPRVRRVGRVPRADLEWFYRGAQAMTFPSRFEGFGMPVLEAMARACPVLAADATALPEVVGTAGMLLAPNDTDAWADAMLQVLEDDTMRNSMRVAGAERAADFSWQMATAKLLDAYRRAASIGKPAP